MVLAWWWKTRVMSQESCTNQYNHLDLNFNDTTDIIKKNTNWQRPKLSVFDNAGSDEIGISCLRTRFDNSVD